MMDDGAKPMIVAIVAKEVKKAKQRRTRPGTVKAGEEEEETRHVIVPKEDKAQCMIWVK